MVFWMIFTLEKRIELLATLFLFMFFISPACLCCCIVHWCKETHLIYGEGRHICLLVITFVLLGLLLWDFVAEFLTKILLKWYLEWLCFWASMFWSCDRKKHAKSQIWNTIKMKWFLLRWNYFPFTCDRKNLFCAMERTQNFVFESLITCPQTRKKGGLNGWWGAKMPVF